MASLHTFINSVFTDKTLGFMSPVWLRQLHTSYLRFKVYQLAIVDKLYKIVLP